MFWLWLATALAAPCDSVPELTGRASAAFDDAEPERAKELLTRAVESLSCQETVVSTDDLLRLYRLDALVSISLEDRKGAVYATIRAVSVDPEARPGDDLGPQLQSMFDTWSERLSESVVEVRVEGDGSAWVDGRPVLVDAPLQVLAGEHLVQSDADGGFRSVVKDISSPLVIETGAAEVAEAPVEAEEPAASGDADAPAEADASDVAEQPTASDADASDVAAADAPGDADASDVADADSPGDTDAADPLPAPPAAREPRRHRGALMIASAAAIAGGGTALGFGYLQEQQFHTRPYTPARIGDCARGNPCYGRARQELIVQDAGRIRSLYAIGYGLTAAGTLLLGTELFVLPAPTESGGAVTFRTRW